jgi:hypothetical protein
MGAAFHEHHSIVVAEPLALLSATSNPKTWLAREG